MAIYYVYLPDPPQEINVIDLKISALQECSATVTKTIKPHPFCLELFSPHMATNAWLPGFLSDLEARFKEKEKNFVKTLKKNCHNDFV